MQSVIKNIIMVEEGRFKALLLVLPWLITTSCGPFLVGKPDTVYKDFDWSHQDRRAEHIESSSELKEADEPSTVRS